jgi:zinc transport system ATP-binding protein
MTPLIRANNITITRQAQTILKDVCLQVNEHDFITIIGPNGAGKSMLLKCLMGFYKPDFGEVETKKNLKIGYVAQRLNANQTLPITVLGFLKLCKKVTNLEIEEIAKEAEISKILNKQLYVLSGGELQRVLLARALLNNPEVLILDEPAQNLDISGQLAFYKLLKEVYDKRKISILMVSHDLHLVMASTKQVICLFHHVCCAGEPQVIAKDPEFIALFGNDMAKMMAVYNHHHNHSHDNCGGHNA